MFAAISRNVILPLYFWKQGDHRLKRLRELEKRQWLSRDEIIDGQFRNFKSLLQYGYDHVPFYRKLYDFRGILPSDVKEYTDIAKLPTLAKKDIQEHLDELIAPVHPKDQLLQDSSGGSTGKPTVFMTDRGNRDLRRASVLMSDQWTGWRVGEKSAYLWGADRDVTALNNFKEWFVERFVFQQSILNAFKLTEESMQRYAALLLKEKPTLIIAYSNVALHFARFLKGQAYQGMPFLKGIVCSAETLTESMRKEIESAFGCKVLNRYGSREIGLIASDCQYQHGLHINAEDVLVEVDVDGLPGDGEKLGEIIVTDLNNRAMPFIRYRTGDVGVASEAVCPCGRGLPLLASVKGRTSDFILHPAGHLIHGESFSHAFYGIRSIKQFQVHQTALDRLHVNVVASQDFSIDQKKEIESKVKGIVGDAVVVNIAIVNEISIPASGKFRFAISDIV